MSLDQRCFAAFVGLGGGAARIAIRNAGASTPSARVDNTGLEPERTGDPSYDSSKKRKAEKDAASSPLPPLAVATSTAKRRQSPPVEALAPSHPCLQIGTKWDAVPSSA